MLKLSYIYENAIEGCKNIKITKDMAREASQYNTAEELLRAGGFSIETLDRAAHGFSEEDVKTLNPDQLNVKWKMDMENPKQQIKDFGKGPEAWAKTVNLSEPIDVSYENGEFWIEDGHHRYTAAKILGKALNVNLQIKDNPILKLTDGEMGYDDFHRCVFSRVKGNA